MVWQQHVMYLGVKTVRRCLVLVSWITLLQCRLTATAAATGRLAPAVRSTRRATSAAARARGCAADRLVLVAGVFCSNHNVAGNFVIIWPRSCCRSPMITYRWDTTTNLRNLVGRSKPKAVLQLRGGYCDHLQWSAGGFMLAAGLHELSTIVDIYRTTKTEAQPRRWRRAAAASLAQPRDDAR